MLQSMGVQRVGHHLAAEQGEIIVKFLFLSKKKILQFFIEAFLEKYYLNEYLNHLE